jgi:hypothetical protein
MSTEHRQVMNSKDNHSKWIGQAWKPNTLVRNPSVLHKWSFIITTPKYEDICVSIIKVMSKLLEFLLSIKTPFGIHKLRYMDKAKSSETSYSSNILDFPTSKEERFLVHILENKFHTELVIDLRLVTMLNPTIKYLFINRLAAKKKRSKRHNKEESMVEAAESVGENQLVWLDSSLKAEIAKLK